MAVKLHFGAFGNPENPPLVILHGLLGSSRNWLSAGRELSEYYNVFALDLRNHGQSPHTDSISFEEMVEDLEYWVSTSEIEDFYILGHSLGGKVAMAFACKHPERIKGLLVEDVAPKEYKLRFLEEFEAMNGLDLKGLKTRKDADDAFAEKIKDWGWRQFLLSNLVRNNETKEFYWQINLKTLTESLPKMMLNSLKEGDVFSGPTLFIRGMDSDYIEDEDRQVIQAYFPKNAIVKINNAGHNVHIDNAKDFANTVRLFRKNVEKTS